MNCVHIMEFKKKKKKKDVSINEILPAVWPGDSFKESTEALQK